MLNTVLIANRGEIAVRIVRTCSELGIKSVVVFSDPDEKALHVRLADEAIRLPGCTAGETYLNGGRIVAAAISSGADAVHPGYGFLSENASFASSVECAGLTFVGPSSEVIKALGDKISARALATAEGIPVIPGVEGADLDGHTLRRLGDDHGWPVLIKPAGGGGGIGMRVVTSNLDATALVNSARAEARAAFGDPTVYAERCLTSARHIELQLMADRHGRVLVLGDRDCSVQRRHQKLVEEAPAPGIGAALRKEMGEAALSLARRVGYVGAGTVEFLVEDGRFYFLEMNTRIQVEHPVTEAVLGIDLVREQLLVAGGEPLGIDAVDLRPRGHSVECRINAEDPARGFLPDPGTVRALMIPWRPGVRLDSGYEVGDEVPTYYDSLLAKLVVWGPTREIALHRLRAVLVDAEVEGPRSTLRAISAIVEHPDFEAGEVSTSWFEEVVAPTLPIAPIEVSAMVAEAAEEEGAWVAGRFHRIPAGSRDGAHQRPKRRRQQRVVSGRRTAEPMFSGSCDVRSPIHATVIALAVAEGDDVAAGQVLGSVEAMKMEHPLTSPGGGRVRTVHVRMGQLVAAGEVLVVVEPPPTSNDSVQPDGAVDAVR